MGKYGLVAESAALSLATSGGDPKAAWAVAVARVFPNSQTSREKGCPRASFLALCGMGFVKDVPHGSYTRSIKNMAYAARAVAEIRNNPSTADDEQALWRTVTEGNDIAPNHQMDVVTSLWRAGLVR